MKGVEEAVRLLPLGLQRHRSDAARYPARVVRFSVLLSLVSLLAACDAGGNSTGQASGLAAANAPEGEANDEESSIWTFSATRDPMTDNQIAAAATQIKGAEHNVDVEVACINGQVPRYTFTFVYKVGLAAALKEDVRRIPYTGGLETYVRYQVRIDNQPVSSQSISDPRFANKAILTGESMQSMMLGLNAVNYYPLGQTLLFRFPLYRGDETVSIDQSDPVVQKVIGPCRRVFQAKIEESKVEHARRRQELGSQVDSPAYDDPLARLHRSEEGNRRAAAAIFRAADQAAADRAEEDSKSESENDVQPE